MRGSTADSKRGHNRNDHATEHRPRDDPGRRRANRRRKVRRDVSADLLRSRIRTKRCPGGRNTRSRSRIGQPKFGQADGGIGDEVGDILVEETNRDVAVTLVIPLSRQIDVLRFIGKQARITAAAGAPAHTDR